MNLKQQLQQLNLKLNEYIVLCTDCKKQLKFKSVHWFNKKPYCIDCRRKLNKHISKE